MTKLAARAGAVSLALLLALPLRASAEVSLARLNAEAGGSWSAGETTLSRLAPEEQRARLGLIPPDEPPIVPLRDPSLVTPLAALPAAFDWRANGGNYVTPVRDQGDCGACWAFAVAGALESKALIAENSPGARINLAEQVLVSCSGAGSCAGGSLDEAAAFLTTKGAPAESCYPYAEGNWPCSGACGNWREKTFRARSFSHDYYADPRYSDYGAAGRKDLLKSLVAAKGPVAVAFSVYDDFFRYVKGVYRMTPSSYWAGYHAVVVVGWKDTADPYGGYFIVKNSWGTGWGEKGYFRVAYDQFTSGTNFGWWIVSLGDAYRHSATPLADLQCPDQAVPDPLVLVGDPFSVQGRIRNGGEKAAPATTARLYLSTDNDRDVADDFGLGPVDVPPLAAGADALVQWDFPAPALGTVPRRVWPIVAVDAGGSVPESNEGNRWKAATALFTIEPPAWVQVLKPNGGGALKRGGSYAFTWGAKGCDSVTVQLIAKAGGAWVEKRTIATGVPAGLGTASWTIGKYFATGTSYRARVICEQDPALNDESDRSFAIE